MARHAHTQAKAGARRVINLECPETHWPRGPMDKASAYRAGDCRLESCRGHFHACRLAVGLFLSAASRVQEPHLQVCRADELWQVRSQDLVSRGKGREIEGERAHACHRRTPFI